MLSRLKNLWRLSAYRPDDRGGIEGPRLVRDEAKPRGMAVIVDTTNPLDQFEDAETPQ